MLETIAQSLTPELKQNNIRSVFTSKKEELSTIREMNPDLPKLFIFDDLAGDREFQDIIGNFYSKGRPNNCMYSYIYVYINKFDDLIINDIFSE